jgi:hypothetical protein
MKVGIVGDVTRGIAWENHLRPHNIVDEVILCRTIVELNEIDACIILDNSNDNLDILLEGVKRGINCFFVAKQPTDIKKLEKIHRSAKESNCQIQFAQWPSLAPATRWMMDKIAKPSFIHIERTIMRNQINQSTDEFRSFWIDELGLCLKWANSGIHHIEAKQISLTTEFPSIAHFFLRFDNGTTASINIYAAGNENRHIRIVSGKTEILECNVPEQTVKFGRNSEKKRIYFEKQKFDPTKAAEKSALLFLKSIQLNKETGFTSYDALQLAIQVERIESRLYQFS